MTQRVTNETLKIIFWFAATGDSAIAREEGTQPEDEEFDTIWTPFEQAMSTLSFDDDRKITAKVLTAAQILYGRWNLVQF